MKNFLGRESKTGPPSCKAIAEILEKVRFNPYNFRITRLSARKFEQIENFLGIKICLYLPFEY